MLKQKIETIINGDTQDRPCSLESLLTKVSRVYGRALDIRQRWYLRGIFKTRKLPCPVISIGNLTTGGTGKTPMTLMTAALLRRMGFKAVVISRGYKGAAEKSGGIVSNGQRLLMGPESAGDEPFMMALALKTIPVIVGADRYGAGMLAVNRFHPDVIVLDDAFQHLKLYRDINLVLLDSAKPFGNRHLLPRGPMRETLSSLLRADVLVLSRWDARHPSLPDALAEMGNGALCEKIKHHVQSCPVFKTTHIPYVRKVVKGKGKGAFSYQEEPASAGSDADKFEFLKGRRIYAFSGIARNDDFHRTVAKFQCRHISFKAFPDHHPYTESDLRMILSEAEKSGADFILTTEKDYVRIAHRILWPIDLVVIGIEISLGDEEQAFGEFIHCRLRETTMP